MSAEDKIFLQCIKEGSKLRVRVISPGYNNEANCQFPRNIRVEGRTYSTFISNLSFSERSGKFFYRVSSKYINIESKLVDKIYENIDSECIICMDNTYEVILVPCGHYCLCKECATKLKLSHSNCPLCRKKINMFVTRDMLL